MAPAEHRRGKWVFAGGLVVATLLLAIGVWQGAEATSSASPSTTSYHLAAAKKATVQQTDTTSSTVEDANSATENFDESGTVDQVDVTTGEEVYAGEDLATLEPSSLDETLSEDETTLTEDQSKLAADESTESLQTAEQQLTSADGQVSTDQAALQSDHATMASTEAQDQGLLTQAQEAAANQFSQVSADSTTVATDQSKLDTSEANLQGALGDYTVAGCPNPPPGSIANCAQLQGAVTLSESDVTKDQAAVNSDQLAVVGDDTTLQADQLALAKTQAQEETSFESATARVESDQESLAQAQQSAAIDQTLSDQGQQDFNVRVEADQAALATAKAQLAAEEENRHDSTLTAPVSGKVVAVNIAKGAPATAEPSTVGVQGGASSPSSGGSTGATSGAIEIQDSGSFVVQAETSGADAEQVAVGDHATLNLSGSGASVNGIVSSIGMAADNGDDVTTRPVTIAVKGSPPDLYSGMSAQATIVTLHKSGVLAVPSDDLHTAGRRTFVDEVVDGKEVEHTVRVGAIGTKLTQITSGLTAGTDVVTNASSSATR